MAAKKEEEDSIDLNTVKESKVSKRRAERDKNNNRKRNRVPISCTICRRRKVKCDKRRPVCAACERTGVAHLCHYIDPPWAQPLSNEELNNGDTVETEVDKLKEKIQQLEEQLQNASYGEPPAEKNYQHQHEEAGSSDEENEADSLNLGKKFDMLHIKSTTTVHLGATSWLAIMKGDPYLRVLWAHIFKMRKQVEEFKFKKSMMKNQASSGGTGIAPPRKAGGSTSKSKCPVAHTEIFKSKALATVEENPEPEQSCPVSGKSSGMGKCPVAHDMESSDEGQSTKRSREDESDTMDDSDGPGTEEDDRVCPLMIGDNSFLDRFKSQNATTETPSESTMHSHKKKKTRSDSNESHESAGRKVAPEDFKANPVEMMQKYLPTKRVLWLFIERFFEVLYIYMPYVDEKAFKEDVRFIMGAPEDEDQQITINIRSGIDFAQVGTVCIILRLVWNTLPMNNSNKLLGKNVNTKTYPENLEALAILQKPENEIPLELVDCVKHCFSNLKLMRKSSLKIVQCGLFMRLYFMYSPEDGDGADGGDSQIFLGMIIQMAISIGLHRDPKNFENFGNERQRHLWRKVWFALISLDVSQSVNLGCPRGLQGHQEFSDTIIPGSVMDGLDLEEFKDDFKELLVMRNIHTQAKLDVLVSKTMKVLLNVNTPAKRYQVDNLIKELQHSISGFGVTQDEYALPQLGKILVNRARGEPLFTSGTRAIQFRAHVTVNMLIYLLNYILYVHFEPRGAQDPDMANIARNYAQKALNCALEGYRNCTLFFDCGLEYFGPGADLVLSPLLLLVGHRSMQFMVSLILRSRCGPFMKANMVQTPSNVRSESIEPEKMQKRIDSEGYNEIDNRNHDLEDIEIIDQSAFYSTFDVDVNSGETLATILLEHMERFHVLAEKLGTKYPYSWRMGKAVSFFITLLKKPTNVVKTIVSTDNVKSVENNTGEISTVLNSVPLMLSADEAELRKCPVFMKGESKENTPNNTVEAVKRPVSHFTNPSPKPLSPQIQPHVQSDQRYQPLHQSQQPQMQMPPPPMSQPSPGFDTRMFSQGGPTPDFVQSAVPMSPYPPFMNGNVSSSEADPSDQPPYVAPPETFVNLTEADRSLGDMFGVSIAGGIPAGASFMNEMSQIGIDNADIPMDLNMMMNGNWFG